MAYIRLIIAFIYKKKKKKIRCKAWPSSIVLAKFGSPTWCKLRQCLLVTQHLYIIKTPRCVFFLNMYKILTRTTWAVTVPQREKTTWGFDSAAKQKKKKTARQSGPFIFFNMIFQTNLHTPQLILYTSTNFIHSKINN
jgi:hypothetical protein